MSGYLEVKFSFKSNRGLNPFKTWKKQWCILRPCPILENSAVIAFHSSFGLAANSTIQVPPGSVVCRTKSGSQRYSFGVYPSNDYRKPHVLLAGQSESEAQMWMSKIRAVLDGKKYFGRNISLKNSFAVSIVDNDFSRKCRLQGLHGILTVGAGGLYITQPNDRSSGISLAWKDITDVRLAEVENGVDKGKICALITSSAYSGGIGIIYIFSLTASNLLSAVKRLRHNEPSKVTLRKLNRRLSRSEGNIRRVGEADGHSSFVADRDSGLLDCVPAEMATWYCSLPPSDVSVDDSEIHIKGKETAIQTGRLRRCPGSIEMFQDANSNDDFNGPINLFSNIFDCPSERRCSGVSLASGVYEEIPEERVAPSVISRVDNTYESVAECVYATMRRPPRHRPPPPLPPRVLHRGARSDSTSDSGLDEDNCGMPAIRDADLKWNVYCSMGSIPDCYSARKTQLQTNLQNAKTLPKPEKVKQTFNVFRKRIKSDSRVCINQSPKSEIGEKTSTIPRKKRFDFNMTPSKSIDLIKNFRVSRVLMRNVKSSSNQIAKRGGAKSCEYLDSPPTDVSIKTTAFQNRCSKSVESLDSDGSLMSSNPVSDLCLKISCNTPDSCNDSVLDENGQDLSMIYAEKKIAELSLPRDVVELILKGKEDLAELKMKQRAFEEDNYMPMMPANRAMPDTIAEEQHYMVMGSPAAFLAANAV